MSSTTSAPRPGQWGSASCPSSATASGCEAAAPAPPSLWRRGLTGAMLLAAALMIGLSLVGATAVLAASLTTSINAETDATFGADYVLTGTGRSPISTEIIDKARAIPGVDAILIAIHGALLGLGLAWGVAGQQVLVGYGITALTIPWTTLAAIVVGAIVIGLIAALLPSLRAARLTPLTALSIE